MSSTTKKSGQMIRWAFGIEAVMSAGFAVPFLVFPAQTLKAISPASVNPDGQSVTLMQWFGGIFLTLMPSLVTTLPDTPAAIQQRPLTYQTLLSAEVVILSTLVWQLVARTEEQRGVTDEFLLTNMRMFVAPMAWRVWVLFFRPQWFGNAAAPGKPHSKTS